MTDYPAHKDLKEWYYSTDDRERKYDFSFVIEEFKSIQSRLAEVETLLADIKFQYDCQHDDLLADAIAKVGKI